MRARIVTLIVAAFLVGMAPLGHYRSTILAADAAALLSKIGVPRGLCVVLGDPQGQLALELARASELTIFAQSSNESEVSAARKLADAAGLLGTRIYVQKGTAAHINLADDLADAVIVADGASGDVIVYWSDGDVGFKFGAGTASRGTFEAVVPASATAELETRGLLFVGYAVLLPTGAGAAIADGSTPDVEGLAPLGVTALDAAIWRATDLSALRPDAWYQTEFAPGFACGRCAPAPAVACSVDADCDVECIDGVCSGDASFDAYAPHDCSALELVSDFSMACNWS